MSTVYEASATFWGKRVEPQIEEVSVVRVATIDAAIDVWLKSLIASWRDDQQFGMIDSLEDGYVVKKPIPYEIVQSGDSFVARFVEGNIAITGSDAQDAYQSLVAEILDTYDDLIAESSLSPDAATQLETLRQYFVRP